MFSAKFKDTANELRQEKIHCDKICQNKSNNKTSCKKQCRIQDKMQNYVKMEINEENCNTFGKGKKIMKLWIITQ